MSAAFLAFAAVNGFIATAVAAAASHVLPKQLSSAELALVETAWPLQFTHALALITVALLLERSPASEWLLAAAWLFSLGLVMFSWALYLTAFSGVRSPLPPLGGVCLMLAWLALAVAALRGLH